MTGIIFNYLIFKNLKQISAGKIGTCFSLSLIKTLNLYETNLHIYSFDLNPEL